MAEHREVLFRKPVSQTQQKRDHPQLGLEHQFAVGNGRATAKKIPPPPLRVTLKLWLGRLSRSELAAWFGRASVYACPARYEPFGLSILEAALSGCALVLGDIPSLRENWHNAALFVPPNDPQALKSTLLELTRRAPRLEALAAFWSPPPGVCWSPAWPPKRVRWSQWKPWPTARPWSRSQTGHCPKLSSPVEPGLVNSVEQMAEAIQAAGQLEPEVCRESARRRFSLERMLAKYFQLYQDLTQGVAHCL